MGASISGSKMVKGTELLQRGLGEIKPISRGN